MYLMDEESIEQASNSVQFFRRAAFIGYRNDSIM